MSGAGARLDLTVGLVMLGGSRARQVAVQAVDLVRRPISRGQRQWEETLSEARRRGAATMAAGRERARRLLRANLDVVIVWVQTDIAPQLISGLVPYLKEQIVPPLIAAAVPQIRADVVPIIVGDLTVDPRVRSLIVDQSRGVLTEATQEVRTIAANADDRLDSAVRRVFGRRPETEGD